LQRCNAITPDRAKETINQLVKVANFYGLPSTEIKQTIRDAAKHVRQPSMVEIARHGIFAEMLDAAWRNEVKVHKFAMRHFASPTELNQEVGEPGLVRRMR
jgi:hypothetical protein